MEATVTPRLTPASIDELLPARITVCARPALLGQRFEAIALSRDQREFPLRQRRVGAVFGIATSSQRVTFISGKFGFHDATHRPPG
jgi:hypothetical protein